MWHENTHCCVKHWEHKDWLQDERFCDINQAMQHRDLFYRMMCEAFESQTHEEVAGRLERLEVTAEAQTAGGRYCR